MPSLPHCDVEQWHNDGSNKLPSSQNVLSHITIDNCSLKYETKENALHLFTCSCHNGRRISLHTRTNVYILHSMLLRTKFKVVDLRSALLVIYILPWFQYVALLSCSGAREQVPSTSQKHRACIWQAEQFSESLPTNQWTQIYTSYTKGI